MVFLSKSQSSLPPPTTSFFVIIFEDQKRHSRLRLCLIQSLDIKKGTRLRRVPIPFCDKGVTSLAKCVYEYMKLVGLYLLKHVSSHTLSFTVIFHFVIVAQLSQFCQYYYLLNGFTLSSPVNSAIISTNKSISSCMSFRLTVSTGACI